MKNIKSLLSIIILFSTLSNLLVAQVTELSDIKSIQHYLGFKSIQEIKNFLESLKEFYYHNAVLIEFFASAYCDPELQKEVQASLTEFRKYNNELKKIKNNIVLKLKLVDLNRVMTLMEREGSRAGDDESETFRSRKEFEPSLRYAKYGFPKLKEKLNQFADILFTKIDL